MISGLHAMPIKTGALDHIIAKGEKPMNNNMLAGLRG